MGAIEKAIARFNTVSDQGESTATSAERQVSPPPMPGAGDVAPAVQLVKGKAARSASDRSNNTFNLPYKAMELEGLLSVSAPRNQMSEEYRAIKRPVLAAIDAEESHAQDSRNVIMVTSCVSGEGKTFSAINLALSIALEKDREVLLVDSDITNPSCGKRLGFDNDEPGLTELLHNKQRDPEDLIWQSDIPNFRFLPAGITHNHVTELLSSRNMADLVDGLSRNHPILPRCCLPAKRVSWPILRDKLCLLLVLSPRPKVWFLTH